MPKSAYVFDFEQPIRELEDRYHHLRQMAEEDKLDLSREIKSAREKIDAKIQEVYNNLTSWQKVQISRQRGSFQSTVGLLHASIVPAESRQRVGLRLTA